MPQQLVAPEVASEEFREREIRRRKRLAGWLGILVGPLGVHKFVLGYNRAGLIMLMAPVVVIPAGWWISSALSLLMGIVGLIEGLKYLSQTPQQFKARYIDAKHEWF